MVKWPTYSLLIVLTALGVTVCAQQFPVTDLYLHDPASISPAFMGKNNRFEVFLTSRFEWTAISGAPFVEALNLDVALPKRMGIGTTVMYNKAGPLQNVTINLAYAYHLKLAEDHTLSFGINGSFYENMLDLTTAVVKDPNDPLLAGQNRISESYFNMGAGLLYNWKTLDVCVTFPLLLNNKSFYTDESIYSHVLTMDRNFLIYLGYTLTTKSDWRGKFGFLYRQTQYSPMSFDISALALYKDLVWLGLLYRRNNIIGITGGLTIVKGFKLTYCYEYSPTAMMGKSYGTHEISIGYQLEHKKEKPSLKDYIK